MRDFRDDSNADTSGQLLAKTLGLPASTLALINLIHKIFSIGLTPVLNDIITLWKQVTAPLHLLLSHIIPFHLPDWYYDLFIISFILSAIMWRRGIPAKPHDNQAKYMLFIYTLSFLISICFLGITIIPIAIIRVMNKDAKARNQSIQILKDIGYVLTATGTFYGINAATV